MKTRNEQYLQRVMRKGFNDRMKFDKITQRLWDANERLDDRGNFIEIRLAAWKDFESAYKDAKKIGGTYRIAKSDIDLEGLRGIFIERHLELCYENIQHVAWGDKPAI